MRQPEDTHTVDLVDVANAREVLAQLQMICDGGAVKRYHAKPVLITETVGEHSFYVAWLCYIIDPDRCTAKLLLAALAHDLPEWKFGDLPSPTKRLLGSEALGKAEDELLASVGLLQKLSPYEANLLALADRVAGLLYCLRERQMGNQQLEVTFRRYQEYIKDLRAKGGIVVDHPRAKKLLSAITASWLGAKNHG